MTFRTMVFAVLAAAANLPASAGVFTNDYSWVHGTHYRHNGDPAKIARELGYGRRVGLNAIRFWISPESWRDNPAAYERSIRDFVRRAWENGYYSVPILFNGNGLAPVILDEAKWNAPGTSASANAAYAAGMVNALKDEPGLLMWDVMNEPTHGNRWPSPPADEAEKAARREIVLAFARRAAAFVKSLDPGSPITFGCENVGVAEELADSVDVISLHDYGNSRTGLEAVCRRVDALRERTGKPVIMNETGCPGHGNPYDMALEVCWRHGFGWFFFDMFPYPNHREEHGVFYEDGTVRDPAAVCAMLGFFRNRNMETMIPSRPFWPGLKGNVRKLADSLRAETAKDIATREEAHRLLEVMEKAANHLEACELVPMNVPPTARIMAWRNMNELPPLDEMRALAGELAAALEKALGK